MKALTLYDPWATLVVLGEKQFETRSWQTSHRGLLAIHVSRKPMTRYEKQLCRQEYYRAGGHTPSLKTISHNYLTYSTLVGRTPGDITYPWEERFRLIRTHYIISVAKTTTVTVEKSQAEIRRIFARYKATGFMFAERGDNALCAFECRGRNIVLPVPMPDRKAKSIIYLPARSKYDQHGPVRSQASQELAYDQEVRQRWRVLVLLLKAKLESIELGVSSFDDEFLSYTMLPSGRTVGQELNGQVDRMMLTGQVPNLLPALPEGRRP